MDLPRDELSKTIDSTKLRGGITGEVVVVGGEEDWSLHQKKIGKPIDNTVKRTMKKIPNKLFTLLRAKSQRFCIKSTSTHSPVFKERMEKNFLLAPTI